MFSFTAISKDKHPRNSEDVSLEFLTENKYLLGLKQNQADKYFRLKMPKGLCISSVPLWTLWLWETAVKFSVKQRHVTETQLSYALVSKNSGFQTQKVLCLLCMTEGENPNMIHHFLFWTCAFKHFQQPVQEAIKELMRSLHMAFGCCGHCVPHRPQCLLYIPPQWHLSPRRTSQPAAPMSCRASCLCCGGDKGLTWAPFMWLRDRLCSTAWAPGTVLCSQRPPEGSRSKAEGFPISYYHF